MNREITIWSGCATEDSIREAALTTSPSTVNSRRLGEPMSPVNASPLLMAIRMRIAINSGHALTGDIGSPKRREFTVLGDVVNIASRLERFAKPGQTLVSASTRHRAGDGFNFRSLGNTALRGSIKEIEVFELFDPDATGPNLLETRVGD